MKHLSLFLFLFSLFLVPPAHSSDSIVVDFRGEQPVFAGEPFYLIDLLERRAPGYSRERITEVIVHATPRSRYSGGYVQLLDDNRRLISEDSLANGYASLPIYEAYQRPAFLYCENDSYLNRIEFITDRYPRGLEQRRGRRHHQEKKIVEPQRAREIGNFVKTNYQSEVKRFSFPSGGFSKINFRVQIGEKHAVIVNSILVLSNQRKLGWKTVGARLSSGDNMFSLDVPEEATDIQVSFAHGQGSSVQVVLLP